MIKSLLLVILTITISPGYLRAADSENPNGIGVSLTAGVSPGGEEKGHYYIAPVTTTKTTVTYGFGIHYRSVKFPFDTKLNLSAESSYYSFDTDPVDLRFIDATVRYTGYTVPVMVWAELMPSNRFGPFIRLGLGAIWTDFKDECSSEQLYSPHHKFWSFSYGMGAGLYYSPNSSLDLLFSVQGAICVKEDVVTNESGHEHTLYAPWGVESYNLSMRYWF